MKTILTLAGAAALLAGCASAVMQRISDDYTRLGMQAQARGD